MSRHRSAGSYGHRCAYQSWGGYRLSWAVDRYYTGQRCRFPRGCYRDTDEAGARRFCKRWGLEFHAGIGDGIRAARLAQPPG